MSAHSSGDGAGTTGPSTDTPADGADPELAHLVDELRSRLRPVCRDWKEAEFEALVHVIARSKVRWARAGYRD